MKQDRPHFVRVGNYWWRFVSRKHCRNYRESLRPGGPRCLGPVPVCPSWFPPDSNEQVLAEGARHAF
jgi:hypothetical protein